MRRRDFITLLGGAAAMWPMAARGQQSERKRRIAVLMPFSEGDPQIRARIMALRQGLEDAGWSEARNLQIDYRWAPADARLLEMYAKELIELRPEVIVTGSNGATTLLSKITRTVPIVFASASNTFETGLLSNMAHPGGNVTGFTQLESPIAGKHLELLKEAAVCTENLIRCAESQTRQYW